jgi:hypothetical protein
MGYIRMQRQELKRSLSAECAEIPLVATIGIFLTQAIGTNL